MHCIIVLRNSFRAFGIITTYLLLFRVAFFQDILALVKHKMAAKVTIKKMPIEPLLLVSYCMNGTNELKKKKKF